MNSPSRPYALSRLLCGVLLLLALLLAWPTSAAERGLVASAREPGQGRRVALVIGNGAYRSNPLRNPVNDARLMADTLRRLGFAVIEGENLDLGGMKKAVWRFGKKLDQDGVGLFYYAGHGVQVGGLNYLIPVRARIDSEHDVELEALDVRRVLVEMREAKNRLNLVFLDACRDNPFARSFRGQSNGLAQMKAPSGTLIAFATGPGETAADGSGSHGIFTQELAREMTRPGLSVTQVLMRTRRAVAQRSNGRQIPWESSSLMGDFYFQPIKLAGGPGPVVDQRKQKVARLLSQAEADLAAGRLTTPQGNNAYELYQRVLSLEPYNATANQGLKRIVGRYVDLAQGRVKAGDLARAEAYLTKAESIAEGDARVLAARDELRGARQAAAKPPAPAPRPAPALRQPSGQPKKITNSIGMEFVLIPAGSFMMGSPPSEKGRAPDEGPQHRVYISKPFYLQTTEVTQGQWQAVMDKNPSEFKQCGKDCPVEKVSWNDAREFIRRLNQKEGTSKYRLPTEAQWEYAARAGGTGKWCFGDDESRLGDYAWYNGNPGGNTHKVATKKPSAWGLYDMHGNVFEWVRDWFGFYSASPARDPQGPSSGSGRVIRGGSWFYGARDLRSAVRGGYGPTIRLNDMGFRVARDAP